MATRRNIGKTPGKNRIGKKVGELRQRAIKYRQYREKSKQVRGDIKETEWEILVAADGRNWQQIREKNSELSGLYAKWNEIRRSFGYKEKEFSPYYENEIS